jgi:hypothetical protein
MYICSMILNEEQIIKLKTKLALSGVGAKGKLAKKLNLHNSQITLMCDSGFVPKHAIIKLNKWLS